MDKRVIRFDGWVVDFETGAVSKDGTTARLQDQPLQVLDELTQRPGEVVSREQLIARLWPTGVVEFDTGLNTAMRKLRVALGDDVDTPRYIETLPRKGYRFIAALEPDPAMSQPRFPVNLPYQPTATESEIVASGRRASDQRAPLKRLALGFGSVVLAVVLAAVAWRMPGKLFEAPAPVTALPTIVVLPLVDMSANQNEQPLCDGLTDELSNWLAHIPTLRVVARTSAFAFQGQNRDIREIATALDATHVLEGSLRRSGEQLRVTVQLIEAEKGLHIWSDTYAMPIGDIFLIEDTVSRSVAEALHLKLSADTSEVWAQRKPQKMEAYELYLLGRARQGQLTAVDNLKSIEYFRRAIAADSDYALALTSLAKSLLNGISLNRMALEDVSFEVEPLINRALALKPGLSDALAMKGWLLSLQYRFDEALTLLREATRSNPNDAVSHRILGDMYSRQANPIKSLEHFTTAAKLDPLNFLSHVRRCLELTDLGEYTEATRACTRARELDPTNLWGPLATAWIDRAQGRTDAALQWIDAALKLAPYDVALADQKITLLLSANRLAEARLVAANLPADDSFDSLSRAASLAYAEGGSKALRDWLAATALAVKANTSRELRELARLQWRARDAITARGTLAHADRVLPIAHVDKVDGGQIRHDASATLTRAGVEIELKGDTDKARKLLEDLDRMLVNYEQNGGRHYGLYSLRAQSFALQGRKAEAQAAIDEAWKRGWRNAWTLRDEPHFAGIKIPGAVPANR